jgi:acyl carrier protein
MKNQEALIKALKDIFEDLDTSSFNLKTEFKNNDEWDSMLALSLIMILDQEFGVSISGEKIKELNTIEELILFVNE